MLDQGKLVGLGTHEELLETCGTYQTLWNYQVIDDLPESPAGRRSCGNGKVPSHDTLVERSEEPE